MNTRTENLLWLSEHSADWIRPDDLINGAYFIQDPELGKFRIDAQGRWSPLDAALMEYACRRFIERLGFTWHADSEDSDVEVLGEKVWSEEYKFYSRWADLGTGDCFTDALIHGVRLCLERKASLKETPTP